MIQKATLEIVVDTEKLGTQEWVTFAVKADPKVPKDVQTITADNYPAVLIAGKILELFCGSLEESKKEFIQPELFK